MFSHLNLYKPGQCGIPIAWYWSIADPFLQVDKNMCKSELVDYVYEIKKEKKLRNRFNNVNLL
jgi:hypothetical protein